MGEKLQVIEAEFSKICNTFKRENTDRVTKRSVSTAYNYLEDLHGMLSRCDGGCVSTPTLEYIFKLGIDNKWTIILQTKTNGQLQSATEELQNLKKTFRKVFGQEQHDHAHEERRNEVTDVRKMDPSHSMLYISGMDDRLVAVENFLKAATTDQKIRENDIAATRSCLQDLLTGLKESSTVKQRTPTCEHVLEYVEKEPMRWRTLDKNQRWTYLAPALEEVEELKKGLSVLRKNQSSTKLQRTENEDGSKRDAGLGTLTSKQEQQLMDFNSSTNVRTEVHKPPEKCRLGNDRTNKTADSRQQIGPGKHDCDEQLPDGSIATDLNTNSNQRFQSQNNLAKPVRNESKDHVTEAARKQMSKDQLIVQQGQEIGELKIRLSQLAGDKLKDNNPNIADLSDTNRPTKLAERFAELYDNEWSDAYEELSKSKMYQNESEVIIELFRVLLAGDRLCKDVMDIQLGTMQKVFKETMIRINFLEGIKKPLQGQEEAIQKEIKTVQGALLNSDTYLIQAHRAAAQASVPVLKMLFKEQVKADIFPKQYGYKSTAFSTYAEKCIEILWLMNAQEMHLQDCVVGKPAPPYFKEYTGRGTIVKATVWPALYLFDGGPMMAKGIAMME